MKIKKNLLGIELSIIVVLVQLGLLQPIVCRRSVYNMERHTEPINGYFRIADTNLVFMHVQDGYGIIINEFITTRSGKKINLVDELSKYYWFIVNGTGIVRSYALGNKAVYRCIESIIAYGNINTKMPKKIDVHHKWWRWCNMQNSMTSVCYKYHGYFHNTYGTRKSHKMGIVFRNVQDFEKWVNIIVTQDAALRLQAM